MNNFKPTNKNAIFPTISNPPTFGTIYLLMQLLYTYDHIDVIVLDKPQVADTSYIVQLLTHILEKVEGRFTVISSSIDFSQVNAFPADEQGRTVATDKDIVTTSIKVYSNLKAKGFHNIYLVEALMGYNESFHRIAYGRSLVYERIKSSLNNFR